MNQKQLFRIPFKLNDKECSYKRICAKYFECRECTPWCELEKRLNSGTAPTELLTEIKNSKLFKLLDKANRLPKKNTKLYKNDNNVCPFFKKTFITCNKSLCPYYSNVISNNCMIGVDYSLSDILVMKNITKKELLITLMKNDNWEKLKEEIEAKYREATFCECEHFESMCSKGSNCKKRKAKLKEFREQSIIPKDVKQYPVILIMLMTQKYYGMNPYLYPKNYLKLYF